MKNKLNYQAIGLSVLAFLMVVALGYIGSLPTQAAPPAAPTPLTVRAGYTQNEELVTDADYNGITADTNTTARIGAGHEFGDFQYVIDQTTTNTTTITIQFSNDGTNWVSGPALVSASAADGGSITPLPLTGYYYRFNVDVTNTNPITIDIVTLLR